MNFKKMLLLIPCMILGLFLFGNLNVSAEEWELVDCNDSVVIGEGSGNETPYYFTDDESWTFKMELLGDKWYNKYNKYAKYTYLTYVIIKPDGSATEESEKINFVNQNGSFTISDINAENYSRKEDVSQRVSVVEKGTYYVEIRYYSGFLGIKGWKPRGDVDVVRVVLGNDNSLGVPEVSVDFNKNTNEFTIEASSLVDGKGYSLIKDVEYYFSETSIENTVDTFIDNMEASPLSNKSSFKKSSVTVNVEKPTEEYNYFYVMVTTYNGYSKIVAVDMSENDGDSSSDSNVQGSGSSNNQNLNNNNDDKSGWPDFKLGELILLVLVVVLIVSCVLIITQKIVDYKKRLY